MGGGPFTRHEKGGNIKRNETVVNAPSGGACVIPFLGDAKQRQRQQPHA